MSPRSQSPATTHYEFIAHTGVEDASAKQKLKTVRSHVMRNYLHQQQRQSGQSSKSAASERRQGKQRARSSRSASQDTDPSTSPSMTKDQRNNFAPGYFGSFDTGLGVPPPGKPFGFVHAARCRRCRRPEEQAVLTTRATQEQREIQS